MNQGENGAVFRVCAVDEDRWDVLQDCAREPVASFADKHSALAYAMNLARGRAERRKSLGRHQEILRSLFHKTRVHE